MKIGIVTELFPDEQCVALIPAQVAALEKLGAAVLVQAGAGAAAGFPDGSYKEKGAQVAPTREAVFEQADMILQVHAYGANPEAGQPDLDLLREGQTVVGFCDPLANAEAAAEFAKRGVTLLSMELMPRISRAQSMDALSSFATILGYKAVLIAAGHLPRMFPMLMTAAGTLTPTKVFIIGAGVMGLQAIATARRLGAVVTAYDVRAETKEQIESLGAKFAELKLDTEEAEGEGGYAKEMSEDKVKKQQEMMAQCVADSDVVITTAAIPGRKSPVLVTADMVKGMAPGSVIVDMAAERGGNCELTKGGETLVEHGVTILGPINAAATVPFHASQMYSKNIATFLKEFLADGELNLDRKNEVVRGTLVTCGGEVVHPKTREILGLEPLPEPEPDEPDEADEAGKTGKAKEENGQESESGEKRKRGGRRGYRRDEGRRRRRRRRNDGKPAKDKAGDEDEGGTADGKKRKEAD